MDDINPLVWFSERELKFVPKHFVRAPTPMSNQSLFWVKTRLSGRYSYQPNYDSSVIYSDANIIYFEDPAELTMYELRWSGANNF